MLKQKLQADQLTAQKNKNQARLDTVRYIVSHLKNKEIALQRELTDQEIISVLQKIKKELQESIDSFTKGGRTDLIQESQAQLDIVSSYLPPELSEKELEKEISLIVEKNKDLFAANPKTLIGLCVRELKAKADPSRISRVFQKLYS